MEGKDFYRVMVVGPTEAGKSQFCNFIQRDLTNSIIIQIFLQEKILNMNLEIQLKVLILQKMILKILN